MHFAEKHQSSCEKSNTKKNTSTSGCQKGKCVLNLTFNSSSFVVFNQNHSFKALFMPVGKLEKSHYHKSFIPKYKAVIWQPPETVFLIS